MYERWKSDSERMVQGWIWGVTEKTVLITGNEGTLQKIVGGTSKVCESRKLWIDAGKSKVTMYEQVRRQVTDILKP